MIAIRRAEPEDAAEIVRLRRIMFAAMNGRDEPGPWEAEATEMARRQLAEAVAAGGAGAAGTGGATGAGTLLGGFVVDGGEPGAPHLAACAVGRVEERLPAPGHPAGRFGFVFNVCTDPRYRGKGFARATTEALLAWFAEHGVTRVDLHATDEAEGMYRALGFNEHSIALSLDLSGTHHVPDARNATG
ncbi:GNAT family N-acetyltransferase [Streptomyces iconiensis]|uniref:GNAT family N-acetyltransferase n=1 Tax=Streptomyces iconiensis TaxID=1384038 RepID=A0ABT7A8T5_9ACTN|nr:GNAT family N-acetyltransferase [Streptomyces iconiensis]MDJ1137710.1 GNAT family N-acetyltransferase [Streptomyces iconiensis]